MSIIIFIRDKKLLANPIITNIYDNEDKQYNALTLSHNCDYTDSLRNNLIKKTNGSRRRNSNRNFDKNMIGNKIILIIYLLKDL